MRLFAQFGTISTFTKREKHTWGNVTFSNVTNLDKHTFIFKAGLA